MNTKITSLRYIFCSFFSCQLSRIVPAKGFLRKKQKRNSGVHNEPADSLQVNFTVFAPNVASNSKIASPQYCICFCFSRQVFRVVRGHFRVFPSTTVHKASTFSTQESQHSPIQKVSMSTDHTVQCVRWSFTSIISWQVSFNHQSVARKTHFSFYTNKKWSGRCFEVQLTKFPLKNALTTFRLPNVGLWRLK